MDMEQARPEAEIQRLLGCFTELAGAALGWRPLGAVIGDMAKALSGVLPGASYAVLRHDPEKGVSTCAAATGPEGVENLLRARMGPGGSAPPAAGGSLVSVPLMDGGQRVGVLGVHIGPRPFTAVDLGWVEAMGNVISLLLQRDRLREMELRDPLTRLNNLRQFEAVLGVEAARSMRFNRDLSLALFDLDGMGAFNERFGTRVGDDLLRQVGRIVAGMARQTDIVCRTGADGFAAVLPETAVEGATLIAERIRASIECMEAAVPGARITASFGVTAHHRGEDVGALVERARRAESGAREAGGNRVVVL